MSVVDLLRHLSILGLASVISGVLVGGVGGRIVMAFSAAAAQPEAIGRITENGNRIGEFTIGGTLGLVVFVGLLGGVAASITVVAGDTVLRRTGGFFGGPIIGAAVLATVGSETFESFDFRILEPVGLNVAMFLGLFLLFGVMVVVTVRLLHRRLPKPSERSFPLYLTVVALGALPLLVNVLFFTSSDFCGCEPWTAMGFLLLLTTLAAIGWHLFSISGAPRWQRTISEAAGIVGLGSILILGLMRVVEDISRIL